MATLSNSEEAVAGEVSGFCRVERSGGEEVGRTRLL